MRIFPLQLPHLLVVSLVCVFSAAAFDGTLKSDGGTFSAPGKQEIEVTFPGAAQLYLEPDRHTFRPQRAAFEAGALEAEVRVESDSPEPVRAVLFFKDKDGKWFQSIEEFRLVPGETRTLSVRLDRPGRDWRGIGHAALFDAPAVIEMFSPGISVYGTEERKFKLELLRLELTGRREVRPLAAVDWTLPEAGPVNQRVESRFGIAREFFNPFDPDEVTVDFELETPDGKKAIYPGFFSRDYTRSRHFTRETVSPIGAGFWEIRFTPTLPGEYKLRLLLEDKVRKEKTATGWKSFRAEPSTLPGPVRVSRKNPRYFERTTGEFFFPVSLNIHTNTDRRSEIGFGFGHLPDRGTYDYEDYLEGCGKNGINVVEVWMAGWTYALEHDVSRAGNLGGNRYNLAAAWKLDLIFQMAERNGILINLIFDNHGRLSNNSDPEWAENPINSRGEFAVANGGFLEKPEEFFRSPAAEKNNDKRTRYIAARWGATPNLMAVELWSEVDLTAEFTERYDEGSAVKWTERAAAYWTGLSQLKLPVTTHVCSDFWRLRRFLELYRQPSVTHLAGDAYRDPQIHFVDHLRSYERMMRDVEKPQLITEYGGNPNGSSAAQILADIHSGLWGSLFARLAGTPFLWWHDFVHLGGHYDHYLAFSRYLEGIDLREGPVEYLNPALTNVPKNGRTYEAMGVALPRAFYAWIFDRNALMLYPENRSELPEAAGLSIASPANLESGEYRLRWYDPATGAVLSENSVTVVSGTSTKLDVPKFRLDLALKLEKVAK